LSLKEIRRVPRWAQPQARSCRALIFDSILRRLPPTPPTPLDHSFEKQNTPQNRDGARRRGTFFGAESLPQDWYPPELSPPCIVLRYALRLAVRDRPDTPASSSSEKVAQGTNPR
jgi:hypothetical protein